MSSPAAAPSSPIAPTPPPATKEEQAPAPPSVPEPPVAPIPTPEAPKDALNESTPAPPAPAPEPTNDAAPVPIPEQKNEPQQQPIPQTPQVYLTFLLLSGHRRTMNFEPATGIGRVKEVVWNGWTGGDWPAEDRPPAPSYLRVLHAGRMLQDDETLANLKLPIHTPPPTSSTQEPSPQPQQPPTTIMHISVRPFGNGEPDLEDGSVKKTGRRGRRRDGTATSDGDAIEEPRSGCCGCIIC